MRSRTERIRPEFDWMVRVNNLLEIYRAVASRHGGVCELDEWFGLPPGATPGFHARGLDGGTFGEQLDRQLRRLPVDF